MFNREEKNRRCDPHNCLCVRMHNIRVYIVVFCLLNDNWPRRDNLFNFPLFFLCILRGFCGLELKPAVSHVPLIAIREIYIMFLYSMSKPSICYEEMMFIELFFR